MEFAFNDTISVSWQPPIVKGLLSMSIYDDGMERVLTLSASTLHSSIDCSSENITVQAVSYLSSSAQVSVEVIIRKLTSLITNIAYL